MNANAESMLRNFRAEDSGILKQLIDATIDASYVDAYPAKAIDFFKAYHSVRQILADASNGHTVVLKVGTRIVATGTLLGNEIRRMFVAPNAQRRGFGRRLLIVLEEQAKMKDVEEIELYASLVARPFYEAMGYRVVSESCVPLDDGQRLDCFVMAKGL